MFANDGSNRSFGFIGVPEGHHDISHHGLDPNKLERKRKIDTFQLEQLAYVLRRLKETKEGDSNLLDNSMVLFGAGISDGNRHNHDNLPVLLAGRAGGSLRTGRHLVYQNHTPLNNLFLSMLDRVGIPTETLGNSSGKLSQLF
jgi:hypothetical protein